MTVFGMDSGSAFGAGIAHARTTEASVLDPHLEAAIDSLGRDRVLDAMRSYGWKDECPPKWAWWCLVNDMKRDKREAEVG